MFTEHYIQDLTLMVSCINTSTYVLLYRDAFVFTIQSQETVGRKLKLVGNFLSVVEIKV